jgi:hypothetical protein
MLPLPKSFQGGPARFATVALSLCNDSANADHSPGSVGLVSRFGQFYKSVDPGLVQVNVCTESLRVVDVKIQISSIGRQMVMSVIFSLVF